MAYGFLALSMSLVGSYVALSKPLVLVFPVFLLAWLQWYLVIVCALLSLVRNFLRVR